MAFGVVKSTFEPSSNGAGSDAVEHATEVEHAANTNREGTSERFVIRGDPTGRARVRQCITY
jgi:hypothetical protein